MKHVPPEWARHKATWTAWPSDPNEWREELEPARQEIAVMVRALSKSEPVKVLAMGDEAVATARAAFVGCDVHVIPARFWDIWMRDMGPIFARDEEGPLALAFDFNGYGGKFTLPFPNEAGKFIARESGTPVAVDAFVLEGGSVDFDGEGRMLTTKECLLNPHRNPGLSQEAIEDHLKKIFDIHHVIWLDEGLKNDHTDGHVDNLARFVGPGRAVCPLPSGSNDPNAATYEAACDVLRRNGLEVVRVPSPGLVTDDEGEPVAASHMNFVIGNSVVLVPAYDDLYAGMAVEALEPLFPGREVLALPSRHILGSEDVGGGSFHCITMQEPDWEQER